MGCQQNKSEYQNPRKIGSVQWIQQQQLQQQEGNSDDLYCQKVKNLQHNDEHQSQEQDLCMISLNTDGQNSELSKFNDFIFIVNNIAFGQKTKKYFNLNQKIHESSILQRRKAYNYQNSNNNDQ